MSDVRPGGPGDEPMEDSADTAQDAPEGAAVRSPRPGASAASRARRIGGRPTARPVPGTSAGTSDADSTDSTDSADESAPAIVATGAADPTTKRAVRTDKTGADSDGEPDAAPRPDRSGGSPAAVPGWLRWAPAAILTAGVIAMAVVIFVVSNGVWRDKPAAAARRDQVLAAAKNCVAAISTYKYTDLSAYRQRGLACSTGQFSKDFAKAVDTLIKPQAPKLKAVSSAQINNGGLQSVDNGQWTVVVYGQVSVTNTSFPKGRLDPLAAVAQMEKRHGKWLIVKLNLLNSS